MKWKAVVHVVLVGLAGYAIHTLVVFWRLFDIVYNRFPGPCIMFHMNGSEDIIVLPNNQAIISEGLNFQGARLGMLNVLDMSKPLEGPKRMTFEGNYLLENPNFTPHGISHWINENGDIFLYVICHWEKGTRDTVDIFQYYPEKQNVRFVKSIPGKQNLNNLIVLDKDEFYVTNSAYFSNGFLQTLEMLIFRLPLAKLYYVKDGKFTTVDTGFKSANGINMSRNKKFIYVANCLAGELIAYERSVTDGFLIFADSIHLGFPLDNLYVDVKTGYIWLTLFPKPFEVSNYSPDSKNVSVSTQVVLVTVNEQAEKPFENSKIESVLMSDGTNKLGGASVAAYINNTLLVGSFFSNLLVCDVKYSLYG